MARSDWVFGISILLCGCAPAGYAYDAGSFVARPIAQPVPIAERLLAPSQMPQPAKRPTALDGISVPPPISDCQAWKDISIKIYSAPSTGIPANDYIGETIKDIHKRGWPEDAAKQLLVVMFGIFYGDKMSEYQFVAEQFKKCEQVAAEPGPKYPNVDISEYWPTEKKAQAEKDFQRTQSEQEQRNHLLGPCLQYKAKAMMIPIYRSKGYSMEQAMDFTAASAYGPGGVAYRGSQEVEELLVRLVRAGYQSNIGEWRDEAGRPTRNFADYAFARCIKGEPF